MAARLTTDAQAAPKSATRKGPRMVKPGGGPVAQLGFFGHAPAVAAVDPAMRRLADAMTGMEPDTMTPLEALTALSAMKKVLGARR